MNSHSERYSRQADVVPAEVLRDTPVTVIGIGALGRQVALQLAAMGIKTLVLVDFDTVDESNLASQGYLESDLGQLKVDATAEACLRLNSKVKVFKMACRFRRSMAIRGAVFCCVDAISTRKLIWEAVRDSCRFFGDGRLTAGVIRVLTVCDSIGLEHYPKTLFTQEEAHAGTCTSKMTIFSANIAAGLLLSQFAKYLRGVPVEPDMLLNLNSMELTDMTLLATLQNNLDQPF